MRHALSPRHTALAERMSSLVVAMGGQ